MNNKKYSQEWMSRKYKIRDQNYPHFVSFSVVHWIDLFTRDLYRQVVIDSIKYCQMEKGLIVYGWCIMTNHVHLIIGTKDKPMQDILRDMKSYTSNKLREERDVQIIIGRVGKNGLSGCWKKPEKLIAIIMTGAVTTK